MRQLYKQLYQTTLLDNITIKQLYQTNNYETTLSDNYETTL